GDQRPGRELDQRRRGGERGGGEEEGIKPTPSPLESPFEQPETGKDGTQKAQLEQRQKSCGEEGGEAGQEQRQPATERPDQTDAEDGVDESRVEEREQRLAAEPDHLGLQEAERAVGPDQLLAP